VSIPAWVSDRWRRAMVAPEMTPSDLVAARHELKMTQHRLARLLGVNDQRLHRWENGKTRIHRSAQMLVNMMIWEQREDAA
jgi:DNA-binding transcriptional regulator YiaG